MDFIETVDELETHYGTPGASSLEKVAAHLSPTYQRWIEQSRFCVLTTVGPEGTDGSPRGDEDPVVRVLDPQTLALPDWRGNNRIDSLRNIVRDGRVSLMFMVPGSTNVVRVNGTARLTVDEGLLASFARNGKTPRTVTVVQIGEIYFQCARAIRRSELWAGAVPVDLPSAGDMLAEASGGKEGGPDYDAAWPVRAEKTMW